MKKTRLFMLICVTLLSLVIVGIAVAADNTNSSTAGPDNILNSGVKSVDPDQFSPAGETVDVCFHVLAESDDAEYMDGLDVDLPDDWTVNYLIDVPGTGCLYGHTYGVNTGNQIYWYTNGWPYSGCGDWYYGEYDFCANVTIPAGCTTGWDFPWTYWGDGYGIPPNQSSGIVSATCFAVEGPAIEVTPSSLFASQEPGQITTQVLNIGNIGTEDLTWALFEGLPIIGWSDNFDSYAPGTSLHGVGGWKGWANSPGATAYTTDVQAFSLPNSVDINGASDLVHEYSGYTSGTWVYSAKQYVPSDMAGLSYFILLNQYDDAGITNNWSVQVSFDASLGQVINTGPGGEILPLITDQWVDIMVVIDLDNDIQTFYYGEDVLYTGSWKDGLSGGGIANIAAVDLFANNATPVYYDDIMLAAPIADVPWLSEAPTSGTTEPGGSIPVDVTFNSTGLVPGTYTASLFALSNDPANPTVEVPVTLEITGGAPIIRVNPTSLSQELFPDQQADQTLQVCNDGNIPLDWSLAEVPGLKVESVKTYSFPKVQTVGSPANALTAKTPAGIKPEPAAPVNPNAVLWEQTSDLSQAAVSDDFPPEGWGAFSADDFQNADPWNINTIFTPGWMYYGSMYDATALHWCLYADVGGVPAGHPYEGGEYWCWSTVPTDPAVTIGGDYGGDVTLDVVAGMGAPLYVPPGTWWLVFYPEFQNSGADWYYWFFATSTNLSNAMLVDPMDYFGGGFTEWTPWIDAGVTYWDIAFRLEGDIATADITWLSENPTAGTVQPGLCQDVVVTFDSTGLDLGPYFGSLDITSNDPDTPLVNVPVELDVVEPDIVVTAPPLEVTLYPDEVQILNFSIENVGTADLVWSVTDGATWLSEFPVEGTIVPDGPAQVVDVTFDAGAQTPGIYHTDVTITSNDPDESPIVLPATLTVIPYESDLSLVKTANADTVRLGDTITYTLVVSNTGPQLALDVKVVDTLPAQVTFKDASAGCTAVEGVVTCLLGDLANGEGATLTIVVTATTDGVAGNIATVSSLSEDPVPANDTSAADVTILPEKFYFYLPIVRKG